MDVQGRCYSSEGQSEEVMDMRRGPWTVEEDLTLANYIANHGEGRWNTLAQRAGLRRTGKSCRLRWLNYLRPDVRRGNITLEEQLLILQLHSRFGSRWSKIAQYLPGRTDNEIKNYWRTRVQKHAKLLKCDVNSKQFKDAMRYVWMPRLIERIQAASFHSTNSAGTNNTNSSSSNNNTSDQYSSLQSLSNGEVLMDSASNMDCCFVENRASTNDQNKVQAAQVMSCQGIDQMESEVINGGWDFDDQFEMRSMSTDQRDGAERGWSMVDLWLLEEQLWSDL